MTSEEPFKIAVSDDDLALLKRKLDDTRLPDEINAAEWTYGAPLADIKRLANRWKDGYDWRTHERKLNALPMFTRTIAVDGFGELNLHYVHQKSAAKGAIPLLIVHGWPGSFLEVTKVLPLLTAVSADHPSFHVVAPNLPGYAWSEAVLKKGFSAKHYAELFNKLMISLGYTEYVTQGGDWGHVLTLTTASLYGPKHVKASHTNLPMCEPPEFFKNPIALLKCLIWSFTSDGRKKTAVSQDFFKNGMGYFAEHSTKPQTLGFSLADSPVGLLAWIYEKLVAWTGAYPWTDDEVLTWVSIFWFSRAGPAASIRIYYELSLSGEVIVFPKTTVPVGLSFFPEEVAHFPKALLRSKGNIVFESEHEAGGHFAAYEQPEALVGDLRKMFGKSGPAAGVVSGCTGY
ncbi:alpha/beta-hydrolase [Lactarius akahatsu]|uniref:Alpha/beta-hydrolase n=1 Tax=Lactarius akahatsu TaxID=416441 RepID=A0AAD4Q2Y5_9AGAM|nr:alpha/beta-hydrolase [Lactarius akahatsu]KAH8981181.1 alpha/beta-hydrolase [Lactarius akahatsu]